MAPFNDSFKSLILKLNRSPIAKSTFTIFAGVGKMSANQVLESECQLRFGLL